MEPGLLGLPPGRGGTYKKVALLSSQQWTVPAGCKNPMVTVLGGGGSAQTCGLGAPGGFARKHSLRLTPGEVIPVTIAAAVSGLGVVGNTTSFGRYMSATGGQSSTAPSTGVGVGGDVNSSANHSFQQSATVRPAASALTYAINPPPILYQWADLLNGGTPPQVIFPGCGQIAGGIPAGGGVVVIEWFEDFTP